MVDIVVAGAAGRMGARIIACLGEAPDLRLVAALEASGHPALGADAGDIAGVGRRGVPVTADATAALTAGRMLVEFSTPDATLEHLRMAAGAAVRAGIRTTGFSPRQRDEIRDLSSKAAILLSPNMSVGVTLALRLLAPMAKALGDAYAVEIPEIHPRGKKDAPGGPAARMAEGVAEAPARALGAPAGDGGQ